MAIRNPVEWVVGQVSVTAHTLEDVGHEFRRPREGDEILYPEVQKIGIRDLRDALARGLSDFGAYRTDVLFIGIIYPLAGLILARVTAGYDMLPLLFPLVSGFALIGPFAAAGLYELSRRRELGEDINWTDAFNVFRSPAIGAILLLGLILTGIFLLWLATAMGIYALTLGPAMPESYTGFLTDVFTTPAGWTLIVVGTGVGFVFALIVLTISVISFPLLLDRHVTLMSAIGASVRAVTANPKTMLVWGMIIAAGLVIGAIPLLLGLIIVVPVLGHATWHLYRKVIR